MSNCNDKDCLKEKIQELQDKNAELKHKLKFYRPLALILIVLIVGGVIIKLYSDHQLAVYKEKLPYYTNHLYYEPENRRH